MFDAGSVLQLLSSALSEQAGNFCRMIRYRVQPCPCQSISNGSPLQYVLLIRMLTQAPVSILWTAGATSEINMACMAMFL